MRIKKMSIFILIIGFLLIIVGTGMETYCYIDGQSKDNEKKEQEILAEYENFKRNTEFFNEQRNAYYNIVAKNLYPESVEEEYETWLKEVLEYGKAIDSVEDASINLKVNCVNKFYSNNDLRNKCDAFVIAYETTVNYYTKDMISFNETIETYKKSDSNVNKEIQPLELKYEFTDINSDGKFFGRD